MMTEPMLPMPMPPMDVAGDLTESLLPATRKIGGVPKIDVIHWECFPELSEEVLPNCCSSSDANSDIAWTTCLSTMQQDRDDNLGGSFSSFASEDTVVGSSFTLLDSEYCDGVYGAGRACCTGFLRDRRDCVKSDWPRGTDVKPRSWTCAVEELGSLRKPRSYSQRYDLLSSNLGELMDVRRRTTSDVMSVTSSGQGPEWNALNRNNSPSRRRRVAVKSNHVRKKSSVVRQRRTTVGTCTATLPSSQNGLRSQEHSLGVLPGTIASSRKFSVALGRKISSSSQTAKRLTRRCSEPFLFDPLILQNNKWNRKSSANSKVYGRRKLSATTAFPTSTKQKLRALAKDELLASLKVPLVAGEVVHSPEDRKVEDEVVEAGSIEKDERERVEQKRMRVLNEILETEKNYISCLETLNLVFKNQLAAIGILTEKELHSLFPDFLDEIKESHSWFMLELEERMQNDNWKGIIGDIFAKMTSSYKANLLEIYTNYVNAFPKSISTLSKCTRSSQKFRKFLEDCYENPLVERLDLPSFLLSPVQRLPRYVLLLRELLKYTKDEHPDRYFVEDAMGKMQALISSLNGSIQNSMDFYAASDEKRRAMSRQFTKRSRKKRSLSGRGTFRQKLSLQRDEVKPIPDADQGYCSFSEAKRESPDSIPSPVAEHGAYERSGQRSLSLSAAELKAGTGAVLRRRKEVSSTSALMRSSESRKSWRRSIGAVLSSLWSTKEEKANRSSSSCQSVDTAECPNSEQPPGAVELRITAPSDEPSSKPSAVKRKNAIPSPRDELPRFAFGEHPAHPAAFGEPPAHPAADSRDTLTCDIPHELSPSERVARPVLSGSNPLESCATNENRAKNDECFPDDLYGQRRVSAISHTSSSSTPTSPVSFQRSEERNSSRSLLGRNMERSLSWQDVSKDEKAKSGNSPGSSPHRRSSTRLSFRDLKINGQSHDTIKISNEDHSDSIENSAKLNVAPMSELVKNSESQSSMCSEPRQTFPYISTSEDDIVDGRPDSSISVTASTNTNCYISNNNASNIKLTKEKKKKFMRSLRNFVRRK